MFSILPVRGQAEHSLISKRVLRNKRVLVCPVPGQAGIDWYLTQAQQTTPQPANSK